MNTNFGDKSSLLRCLILPCMLLAVSFTGSSQETNQHLYNGRFYLNTENIESGSPFLFNDFTNGDITLRNQRFEDVQLKYDLYRQIVIVQSVSDVLPAALVLPNVFIEEFRIGELIFRRVETEDGQYKFMQALSEEDDLAIYRHWSKNRFEGIDDSRKISYKYSKLHLQSFLRIGGQLKPFRNNGDIVKLMPEALKEELSAYLKEEHLKVNKSDDADLEALCVFLQNTGIKKGIFKPRVTAVIPEQEEDSNGSSLKGKSDYDIELDSVGIDIEVTDGGVANSRGTDGIGSDSLGSDGLSSDGLSSEGLGNDSLGNDGLGNDGLGNDGLEVDKLLEDDLTEEKDAVGENANESIHTLQVSQNQLLVVGNRNALRYGRKYLVQGTIKNMTNQDALLGATIYVKETGLGSITDSNGYFSFYLPAGEYNVEFDHMAMKKAKFGLKVLSSGRLDIELEEDMFELAEVMVTNDRYDQVKSLQMGFERLNNKTIKEIPAVMGEKDILKVAQMLPGVQTAGEGSAGISVRGGGADQNMFYLNKITIYNTSHLFGFFSAFSPDIVRDFSLYKNNVPAKYGGRIASVFEIGTRQGNKEHIFAQGGISPVTGHLSVDGPIVKDKVSVIASVRSTYSDWLLRRVEDDDIRQSNASFQDYSFGIHAKINDNNQLYGFIYRSSDEFSLADKNIYAYANKGESLNFMHRFGEDFHMDMSVAKSYYENSTIDKNNITEAYRHEYDIDQTEGRIDFSLESFDKHKVKFGANGIRYTLDRGNLVPYGAESTRVPVSLGLEYAQEYAAYISDDIELHPRFFLSVGARYSLFRRMGEDEIYHYLDDRPKSIESIYEEVIFKKGEEVKRYSGFEPRTAFNFRINQHSSLKASYNRMQQYLFLLSNTVSISPTDQWKLCDYHIRPPMADQLSLGYYQHMTSNDLNISVEVYKKWGKDVVEFSDGADFISAAPLETEIVQGAQEGHGLELMVKKNSGALKGWVSYAYSRSVITLSEDQIFPSNFDKPHSFNFVGSYRFNKRFSISSNIAYSSGRPITLPIGSYYSEGDQLLLFSERNAYRIPDYFRIDFSINVEGNLKYKKLAHSYWMLNFYNLTGRKNAYSIFYEVEDGKVNGYKLSVFARPIITLSWNFKIGNYNNE